MVRARWVVAMSSLVLAIGGLLAQPMNSSGAPGAAQDKTEKVHLLRTVDMKAVMDNPQPRSPNVKHLEVDKKSKHASVTAAGVPRVALGGSTAPVSPVAVGGDNGNFNGIDVVDMTAGGSGNYAQSNGTLEPPDQAMCVGSGYVLESVNDSVQIYNTAGTKYAANSVPLSQFYGLQAGNSAPSTDFISDPRCYYDHATQRWFMVILDVNEPLPVQFFTDHNVLAVSKTSNPLGAWNIYSFDVTDDGVHSPAHVGCVGGLPVAYPGCLGDQPLLGADANGIYITDNEYSYAEILLVAPIVPPFQQLPVLRSGVAQLYALSKAQLVSGTSSTLVRLDSNTIPFPGPSNDSPWQSVQPATSAPGDASLAPPSGVEYFMSDIGLPVSHDANQIVVWAWTNTASLNAAPSLTLQHKILNTQSPTDTFYAPDVTGLNGQTFATYQKATTDHPYATTAGDPEAHLNANDDRMNAVTLVNNTLWAGVNTQLPPVNPAGTGLEKENRVGIMYFQVRPMFAGPTLDATMVRDGYVNVPRNNVLFPSIGARTDGATIATFTLAGMDFFPSVAWARLDGLAPGTGPTVHVSRLGSHAEDGFSAYGLVAEVLFDPTGCNPCTARWGDYSASQVDEAGCFWGAAEYIPAYATRLNASANWGTGIHRICPPLVVQAQPVTPAVAIVSMPDTATGNGLPAVLAGLAFGTLLTVGGLVIRRRRRTAEGVA